MQAAHDAAYRHRLVFLYKIYLAYVRLKEVAAEGLAEVSARIGGPAGFHYPYSGYVGLNKLHDDDEIYRKISKFAPKLKD